MRASLTVALASFFIRRSKLVFVITGLGLLDLETSVRAKAIRKIVYAVLQLSSAQQRSHFIFENGSDPAKIGLTVKESRRHSIFMGAGVDLLEFEQHKMPAAPPYRLATVSRLIWSKGIDLSVEAVSQFADEGFQVQLDIYGANDPANPRPANANDWIDRTAVLYKGYREDIQSVWEEHHIAIFASRGGEGLPRSLLEAAACGRPCIVTDVSGCSDFVRDGVEGLIAGLPPLKWSSLKYVLTMEDDADGKKATYG